MMAGYPRLLLLAALLMSGNTVQAVDSGSTSPYDYRIRKITYNPQDVVRLNAIAGIATHIVVGEDESYVTHAFGDSQSWAFTHVNNHFFVKPILAMGDTNLTIVTDKHDYNIVLHYVDTEIRYSGSGKPILPNPWARDQATLQLTYEYPFSQRQNDLQKKLEQSRFDGLKNYHYLMSNEKKMASIQPLSVVDNRQFTRFIFPAQQELPVIFVISATGKEQAVNTRVIGEQHNILEAEGTAGEWRIRLGEKVVGIRNLNYDPLAGNTNTGTASAQVKRVKISGENE